MDPAGMVHALEIIRDLLVVDGILIDIHPNGQPPTLEVDKDRKRQLAGYLQESDNFIEYTQAAEALDSAIQQSWFTVEQQDAFNYQIFSTSLQDFLDYLAENYQDAILVPETSQKIEAVLGETPASMLVYTESVLITRLRRIANLQTINIQGDNHGK